MLAIVGVAFAQMGLTDDDAGRWMIFAGPLFLAVGAYLFWAGRKANATTKG